MFMSKKNKPSKKKRTKRKWNDMEHPDQPGVWLSQHEWAQMMKVRAKTKQDNRNGGNVSTKKVLFKVVKHEAFDQVATEIFGGSYYCNGEHE